MAVSARLRFEILRRDGFRCRYCGTTAAEAKLHVDHVYPRALGGPDEDWNLVAACELCNLGKSATDLDDPMVTAPQMPIETPATAEMRRLTEVVFHRVDDL